MSDAGTGSQLMPFKVMTWNVLAHINTHWDHNFHGGAERTTETELQRDARHAAIVKAITRELPDVVLLQEVDDYFMPTDWEGGLLPCGVSLPGYVPFKSYAGTNSGHMEGVVVLLRAGFWDADTECEPVYLERCEERGWKCGIVVSAQRCGDPTQRCTFVSTHLRFGAEAQKMCMLSCLLEAAQSGSSHVVLGGDFNTQICSALEPLETLLGSKNLRRVPIASGTNTSTGGMKGPEMIDYIYSSTNLEILGSGMCNVGALPPLERGAWSDVGTHDGSDHAWLTATFSCA